MYLIFAVLDVSLTMGLTRCYKTESFFYIYLRKMQGRKRRLWRLSKRFPGNQDLRAQYRKICAAC